MESSKNNSGLWLLAIIIVVFVLPLIVNPNGESAVQAKPSTYVPANPCDIDMSKYENAYDSSKFDSGAWTGSHNVGEATITLVNTEKYYLDYERGDQKSSLAPCTDVTLNPTGEHHEVFFWTKRQ